MWERNTIPGYAEAQDSERVDRSLAFLGISERIAGVECAALTPHRVEFLRAFSNPFIVGGVAKTGHILQFIWLVNPDFQVGKEHQQEFVEKCAALDLEQARKDIDQYLDRAFLDAPYGASEIPYAAFAAHMIYSMAGEPFRWAKEQTLHTPLAIMYQLLKCDEKAHGRVVINRRSDKSSGDWLAKLNKPKPAKRKRRKHGE